jgi:hypothetical protein
VLEVRASVVISIHLISLVLRPHPKPIAVQMAATSIVIRMVAMTGFIAFLPTPQGT